MTTTRQDYFKALDLTGDDNKEKRENALARAYELRTFEIEHYWKRATYFWGFQIAIFAAFGFIWKDMDSESMKKLSPIVLGLAILGITTSYANIIAAIGSRFWQKNWELHIDMLEDEFEGKLYKTVWRKKRLSYSLSKINIALGICFLFFWIFVDMFTSVRFEEQLALSWALMGFVQVGLFLVGFLITGWLKSDLPPESDSLFVQRSPPAV